MKLLRDGKYWRRYVRVSIVVRVSRSRVSVYGTIEPQKIRSWISYHSKRTVCSVELVNKERNGRRREGAFRERVGGSEMHHPTAEIIKSIKVENILDAVDYDDDIVDTRVGNVFTVDDPEHYPEIGWHIQKPAFEIYPLVGRIFDLK